MGDRVQVSVPALLDAAGRADIAIEMASEDLTVVARGLSESNAAWPGDAAAAYSALLTAWGDADAALSEQVKDLARTLQVGAAEYAEAERLSAENIKAEYINNAGFPTTGG